MPRLPAIKGKVLIKFLETLGFAVTRVKGSHVRLRNNDARATTIQFMEIRSFPKDS